MVDKLAVIQWFRNHEGKLTYSMYGSRNGADGTADCSGSMTQAIYEAGGTKPAYLYSTETIHPYLVQNGYKLVVENADSWDAKTGDIVIWGQLGASAGAGGHIMVISEGDPVAKCISTCYYTSGQEGTAVQELDYNYFASLDGYPYYYVYRMMDDGNNGGNQPAPAPTPAPQPKTAIQQFKDAGGYVTFNNTAFTFDEVSYQYGLWQGISNYLAGGNGASWFLNGIPLALVYLPDKANQNDTRPGDRFIFYPRTFPIVAYDYPSNGICVDAGNLGKFWVNADVALNA